MYHFINLRRKSNTPDVWTFGNGIEETAADNSGSYPFSSDHPLPDENCAAMRYNVGAGFNQHLATPTCSGTFRVRSVCQRVWANL